MYKFEVVVKRDGEEFFHFGLTQAQLDIADKLGVSRHEFIEQVAKLKMEEWRNANLSDSK